MLVYIICTERKEGVLPSMDDGDIVDRKFYLSFEAADKARARMTRSNNANGFESNYQIYSVDCVVQQRVEFEAPF
jgi:hypothetical protein